MEQAQVIQMIQEAVPGAEVLIEGADCNFTAVVLSEQFEGLSPVKRQQRILAGFSDLLSTGQLHALSVKAHTPAEWSALQQQSLAQITL